MRAFRQCRQVSRGLNAHEVEVPTFRAPSVSLRVSGSNVRQKSIKPLQYPPRVATPDAQSSEFNELDGSMLSHRYLETVALPDGVRVVHVSRPPSESLPFLLYLPDIDGSGVTSRGQWQSWSERFDLYTLQLGEECNCSFGALATATARWLTEKLQGTPPERPVYLLGEGFGAVLALQLAYDCRRVVNRLVLVNPATSYADSQLARITALLERLPPALLSAKLPPPPLPLPLPLPPAPLPLALAPLLGTSPQALLKQLAGSITSQHPADAVQVLSRALAQVDQISSTLTPAAFLHRLRMLDQGIRMVSRRLSRIPQRTMILAGGQDVVLGSDKEAQRLVEAMQRAFKKVLPDSGHALLYEPGGDLLPLLEDAGFYTTTRTFTSPPRPGVDVNVFGAAGPVEVPSQQEVQRYAASWTARLREFNSPVFLSTRPDGNRVLGLEGLPSRGLSHHQQYHHQQYQQYHPQHNYQNHHGGANGNGDTASGVSSSTNGSNGGGGDGAASVSDDGVGAGSEEWGDGPLLFVGNHQLYAFDMSVMVEEVLTQKGILMRGLAHPGLFRQDHGSDEDGDREDDRDQVQGRGAPAMAAAPAADSTAGPGGEGSGGKARAGLGREDEREKERDSLPPAFMGNMFQSFGAVRVTPTAMFRLLAAGEAVLLYPGGVREGFKRRNEKYELFWPSRSEFVRMAARFNATIIPVSAVGLEDSLALLLDSDDIRKNPFLSARALEQAAAAPRARLGVAAEDAPDETFIPPLIAPAVPSRFYFLFGRPFRTNQAMYRDRAACDQLYAAVRSEVEDGISYLLRKREQDPYRDFLTRYVYERNPPFGPRRVAPTFKP